MNTHELNLKFESYKDCKAWEDAHIIDNKYNGETVLMINHQEEMGEDWIILTSIITIG